MKIYSLTLTEEQFKVLKDAVDHHFEVNCGEGDMEEQLMEYSQDQMNDISQVYSIVHKVHNDTQNI